MSDTPSSGVRYVLERVDGAGGEGVVLYRGRVHLPDAALPLEVRIEKASGQARASIAAGEAWAEADVARLSDEAARLVRSATKAPLAAGQAPPRKIARWRGGP